MKSLLFDKLAFYTNSVGEQTSIFILKDLAPGQALTIGNTLRRILLTDLKGTAITAVKIGGINNEFATIPGVREDVLELLLNLKQTKIKGYVDQPCICQFHITGPQIINANQLAMPKDLSVINSNHYIATVSDQTRLDFELKIQSGYGYHLITEDKSQNFQDFLPVDSIFTPVQNVNYQICDSYRIDQEPTEELRLEITTNGSINPTEALNQAAETLQTLFGSLIIDESPVRTEKEQDLQLDILIEELQLSVRAYNCLKRMNIQTIADLLQFSVKELKEIKNFGQKSANEVIEKLQDHFDICLQ